MANAAIIMSAQHAQNNWLHITNFANAQRTSDMSMDTYKKDPRSFQK